MNENHQIIKKIFLVLILLVGSASNAWAIVDNRLCTVGSSLDDGSLNTLRRHIDQSFNKTNNRACTEIIRFTAGANYTIILGDTLKVGATNSAGAPLFNDTDTDVIPGFPFEDDAYNLLVDGRGATITIDATGITPARCAIDLLTNNSKWQNMTVRVTGDASKAFCDHGTGNHHVDGEDNLHIVVVGGGTGTPQPPVSECNASNPCCNAENRWRPIGEACEAPDITEGHCDFRHQCIGRAPTPTEMDSDGVADAMDNCPLQNNADQADSDHDGVGNICDNCPTTSNGPLTEGIVAADIQKDSDADGEGDVCEAPATDTGDSDGDGVPNAVDNCQDRANADQHDLDGDATGDACDNDRDGDGIADNLDAHPDDRDWDHDGVIDGVDNCLEQAGPASNRGCPVGTPPPADNDGDGVPNDRDQCPAQAGSQENGCPSDTNNNPPQDRDPAGPNLDEDPSACNGSLSSLSFNFNGKSGQGNLCNPGGCSLAGDIVAYKGHYFMALLAVAAFLILGSVRYKVQKNSNK